MNTHILIYQRDKKTIAKEFYGSKAIRTEVAKCSPEDRFDFHTGAKIALDRLTKSRRRCMNCCHLFQPTLINSGVIFRGLCFNCRGSDYCCNKFLDEETQRKHHTANEIEELFERDKR